MLYKVPHNINDESVLSLMNVVNELQPYEELNVYLKGDGGETSCAEAMIDILNNLALTNAVTLTAYESINSCHFSIFFETKCYNKVLLPSTKGLMHKCAWTVELMSGGKPINEPFIKFKMAFMENVDCITPINKLVKFNSDELKRLKNNEDVWFLPSRMKELLEYNLKKTKVSLPKMIIHESHKE